MPEQVCKSIVYQIDKADNVAVALSKVEKGLVSIRGESGVTGMTALDEIEPGHKLAVKDIKKGEDIIKYGITIGEAVDFIKKGSWVHLHNVKSKFDERSSTLDFKTGVSTEIRYGSGDEG